MSIPKKQVNVMEGHGKIVIKLEELIAKAGISKNKVSHKAEMQRTQLNNYCKNNVTKKKYIWKIFGILSSMGCTCL